MRCYSWRYEAVVIRKTSKQSSYDGKIRCSDPRSQLIGGGNL